MVYCLPDMPPPGRPSRTHGLPAGRTRRPPPPDVVQRVAEDPLFRILSRDGSHWFDPFTGDAVLLQGERAACALAYLAASSSWIGHQPLSAQELQAARWRHDLARLLPKEPRLRIFSPAGAWLNPWTGDLHEGIPREEGRITQRTLEALARILVDCPAAQSGSLLDSATLMTRLRPARTEEPVAAEAAADRRHAQRVQQRMLSELPTLPGYLLAAHYASLSEVSGDLYEASIRPDGSLLLVLGDVSGHGVQAALVGASALKALRLLGRNAPGPRELLAQLNEELARDLMPGHFVTCFAALLEPASHRLTCACAGHHAGLLATPSGQRDVLRRIGPRGPALGLLPGPAFRAVAQEESTELPPGATLLLWSDGASEAAAADGTEFGEPRLFASLLAHCHLPLQEQVDAVALAVTRFTGRTLADDLTLLALQAEPATGS